MKELKCKVTSILSTPYMKYNKWFVDIKYICMGTNLQTNLYCESEEQTIKVKVGYEFYL